MLYIIPFISAAIGWFTNYVAIKMLFHPRRPVDLLVTKLQGIFPKRKEMLAERLGRVVARDLFSMDMVKNKIDTPESKAQIKTAIMTELEDYLKNRLLKGNALLAMMANDKVITQVMQRMDEMMDELVPKLVGQLTLKLEEVDVEKNVYNKVVNFSDEKFENLLMSVIKKELKFIEIAGAVLGFVIGVVQVGLLLITGEKM